MADNRCNYCGKYEMLPFNCKYCGGVYCSTHRLPEYHECTGLRMMKEGTWKPPVQSRKSPPVAARRGLRLPKVRLPARGYYAYILIAACVLVFILQSTLPAGTMNNLELSRSSLLSAPWTLVTYMFLHANILHIFFNMLMLFFFGPMLERQIGSVRFLGLYLGSGVLAGLVQVLLFPGAVIGASAAIFGVMGALTVLMPDLRVYLYFIPMKILYVTIIFAALDVLYLGSGDAIAHGAHLVGLAVGALYGYLIRMNRDRVHAYWPV
jgi:rhomboid family protein